MTAFSVVGRATGMGLPLLALYYFEYPITVIAFWLLLTTIQSLVGALNGTLPTVSMQMIAYAQAGSKKLFGSIEDHQIGNIGEPDRELTAQINRALVRTYAGIQAIWITLAVTGGTAIIWSSLLLLPSFWEGIAAWSVFIFLATIRLRLQPYVSYLFAIGKTPYARRLEGFSWLVGSIVTTVALATIGNFSVAIFCLYAPALAQLVLAKKKAASLGWEDKCDERFDHQEHNLTGEIWPRAWRGSLGILAGMVTLYGGGFIYAQYGDPTRLAEYLLAINILGIVQQIAVSPLYGALPAMANRYAGAKRDQLFEMVDHVMRRSNWVFAVLVIAVPIGLYFLREFFGIVVEFVSLYLWTALCAAGYLLRYGGGHLHFYTLTNRVILHWVNGLLAVLYLVPLLILHRPPLIYYPLIQGMAGLFFVFVARYLTRQYMGYPLRRDLGFTLFCFALMVGVLFSLNSLSDQGYFLAIV